MRRIFLGRLPNVSHTVFRQEAPTSKCEPCHVPSGGFKRGKPAVLPQFLRSPASLGSWSFHPLQSQSVRFVFDFLLYPVNLLSLLRAPGMTMGLACPIPLISCSQGFQTGN